MPVGRPGHVLPVWTFRVVVVVEGVSCPVAPASSGGIREMRGEGVRLRSCHQCSLWFSDRWVGAGVVIDKLKLVR